MWDKSASERVDYFIANSKFTAKRIKKFYGRGSEVIYPPVDTVIARSPSKHSELRGFHSLHHSGAVEPRMQDLQMRFHSSAETMEPSSTRAPQLCGDYGANSYNYFLIVSRLSPYKKIDIAIEAFNKLELPLVIIGEGNDKNRLMKIANKNIKFLGFQPEEKLMQYYKNCYAFIFPGEDDFGITPIEAMSFGKPILAYRKGGVLETVIENEMGEFFDDPIPEILADGVRRLKNNYNNYSVEKIKKQAEKFSEEKFKEKIKEFVRNVDRKDF